MDICPVLQQQFYDLYVPVSARQHQRSVLVVVLGVNVHALLRQQELHSLHVAEHHRPVQRTVPCHVLGVHGGKSVLRHQLRYVQESLDDGSEEGCLLVDVLQVEDVLEVHAAETRVVLQLVVHDGLVLDAQLLHHSVVVLEHGPVQRRLLGRVVRVEQGHVDVQHVVQHVLEDLVVAARTRVVQQRVPA